MRSLTTLLSSGLLALAISISLSACQPKATPVTPDANQQAKLDRLHKRCIAAAEGQGGRLKNLARLRKKQSHFTCDEMKQICETDYTSQMCAGTMTVASIENAYQQACRKSQSASRSSACAKLDPCNRIGFESPECASAIIPYNR